VMIKDSDSLMQFPTGKSHISFSEVRIWKECGWKHKLTYIDKVAPFQTSVHLEYGTIIHNALEHYLTTKEIDIDKVKRNIEKAWNSNLFDSKDYVEKQGLLAESQGWKYKHNYLNDWLSWAEQTMIDVPVFLNDNYPNWECVSAEEALYEEICTGMSFKGFIDGIIKYKKRNKEKYVILDWKTASPRGWRRDKKQDIKTTAQLVLYKHYWGSKNKIQSRDISCHFILLKRGAKPGKVCQIVEVSAGPKSMEKANKMVSNMLSGVNRRFFLKNRNNCKFCPFEGTDYCK